MSCSNIAPVSYGTCLSQEAYNSYKTLFIEPRTNTETLLYGVLVNTHGIYFPVEIHAGETPNAFTIRPIEDEAIRDRVLKACQEEGGKHE